MTELLAAARALRPLLREQGAAIERERRLTVPVIDAFEAMDAFRLQLDREHRGAGADTPTYLAVIEALSRGDASAGWVAMVASESGGCAAAYLEGEAREAVLAPGAGPVAFTAVGKGAAHATDGSYMVSGRWRFASGCRHAEWLAALCVVHDGGTPRLHAGGGPELLVVMVPAARATLLDTWQTSGLRGTASDDFVIENVEVPAAFGFDLAAPARDPAPQWRIPLGLRLGLSKGAAVLGIARAVLDHTVPGLERTPYAGARPAREEPRVQIALAEAEAALRGARAYFQDQAGRCWHAATAGEEFSPALRADIRLAIVASARGALAALRSSQRAAGTSAVLDLGFDRAARDLEVARHHLQLQDHVVEDVGRVLLGFDPLNPLF